MSIYLPKVNNFIKSDCFCDYTPFVSTVTNITELFINLLIKRNVIDPPCSNKLCFNIIGHHVNRKPIFRCVILLIPLLGNLIIFLDDRSKHRSFLSMKKIADQGDLAAQKGVAEYLAEKGSSEEAFHYYKLVADQGDLAAQKCVAHYLAEKEESEEAFYYYKLAADQGDLAAQKCVAHYLAEKEESEEAFYYYKLAADQGDLAAQKCVARYLDDKGSSKEAFNYYKLAADQGDLGAKLLVACKYLRGEGVGLNIVEAENRLNSLVKDSYAPALFILGQICFFGLHGFQQDYKKAFILLKKFESSMLNFCKENDRQVIKTYECLSKMYEEGLGVEKDIDKARGYKDLMLKARQ